MDRNCPPGQLWLPVLRVMMFIERQGFLHFGTPKAPFDPRMLIWNRTIDRGAEAGVKLVALKAIKTPAAVKRFGSSYSQSTKMTMFNLDPAAVFQELAVLAYSCDTAPNIINLLGIDKNYSFNNFTIFLEVAKFGSLTNYLNHHDVDEGQAGFFAAEVTSAVVYLHDKGILHNDLKTDNVLVVFDPKSHGSVSSKLIDFGHAIFEFKTKRRKDIRIERVTLVGTKLWAAPELLDSELVDEDETLSATSDIYSLGLLIGCLAARRNLFSGTSLQRIENWKFGDEMDVRLCEWIPPSWHLMLHKACRLYPSERSQSANEILDLLKITIRHHDSIRLILIEGS